MVGVERNKRESRVLLIVLLGNLPQGYIGNKIKLKITKGAFRSSLIEINMSFYTYQWVWEKTPLRGPVHKKGPNRSLWIEKALLSLFFFSPPFSLDVDIDGCYSIILNRASIYRFRAQLMLVSSSSSSFSPYSLHLPTPCLAQSTIVNTSSSLSTPIYQAH